MTPIAPLLFAALAAAQAPSVPRRVSAWLVPWDELPAAAVGSCVQELNPFVFAFDAKGKAFLAYPGLLQRVVERRDKLRVVPVIVNDVLESGHTRQAKSIELLVKKLNSDKLVQAHVEELLEKAAEVNADGLEIDYERVPPALYGRFTDLLERLGAELHKRGNILAVDLEAGPLAIEKGEKLAQDYWPRIARGVDEVKIMMYYERGDFSDTIGPGSSLSWIAENGRNALSLIPADKLFLAISLSGTDWQIPYPAVPTGRHADRLHYGEVMSLLRRVDAPVVWNDTWSAPVFRYEDKGQKHEVWFEDERSLTQKIQTATGLGAGAALWYLGSDHPDISKLGLCQR